MSNREIFIDKLRQLSKEEMLERYIALLNTEKLTDYVADLEAKLAESEIESLKVDGVLNEELEEKDYTIIKPFLKETLTIEEIKHIIKNLSDFNLRQTSFHDIQKKDVIFNAYINKHIAYKKCLDLLDLVDQDKISFSIEQLSTLRNFVNSKAIFSKNECEREVCRDISQTIDNRIKQLKEGV